ncbi:MAG: hypothetical protein IJA78_00080 [Clostridia bacterium]|nr:hypothetical protein [Clostridia bacterium]
MKRLLPLLLALLLLLTACGKKASFERDADGMGYTDTKTEVHYRLLEPAYVPAAVGEEIGFYQDREHDFTCTFYKIPELDPSVYLTDDQRNVYVAGDALPDASGWEIAAILVCDYDEVSVERFRLTAAADAATVAKIRTLWFEGDGSTFAPITGLVSTRRLQLMCDDYPNLFYCFTLSVYEGGDAYFSDTYTGRTVAVPAALATLLQQY